jgi:hypothetical protein
MARTIAEITGVDFAVYKDGNQVVVESDRGQARIEHQLDTNSYQYSSVNGDPLELGRLQSGFVTDKEWFEKTAGHKYPDAVPNIYKSLFTSRVKQTADILVSMKDGFYYGWSPFGRFVRLAATHGNALQSSSNAFMMSTHRELPSYVRADDAKALLRH